MEEVRLSILDQLDKLEEVFLEGSRIPFSGNRLVNEQDAIDILDEIRETLPNQIVKAKETMESKPKEEEQQQPPTGLMARRSE